MVQGKFESVWAFMAIYMCGTSFNLQEDLRKNKVTVKSRLLSASAADWFIKDHAKCYKVYVIMCVEYPQI